ncbi:MAG: ribonuclease HII [Kiloniellales bacterium]|nr:ribonuclease HII [Kiloniellales bacterium]
MPDFVMETEHGAAAGRIVVGIDEAGRGPWAGPVTAAAAWLEPARLSPGFRAALDDSKRLARPTREAIFEEMLALAAAGEPALRFALGEASVEEIDRLNILQASLLAMARAVAAFGRQPDIALVDGNRAPALACRVATVVGGDARCLSIAAASIAAKVTRDRLMAGLAERHPGYGWETNAGYGTGAHHRALRRLGVTPHHRRSFAPIREALNGSSKA